MTKKYTRLTLDNRYTIEKELSHGKSYQQIGEILGFDRSRIYREVNSWSREKYKADKADEYAVKGASGRKQDKIKIKLNKNLRNYISEKLELRWSPEQISKSLKKSFPTDPDMQIILESIYRYVYLHAKKSLREELTQQLRREKKSRGGPRKNLDNRGKIADAISIDERPAEVIGREIPVALKFELHPLKCRYTENK